MTDLRTRLLALRELGPSALLFFAEYRLGLATGQTERRTPAGEWADRPAESWLRKDVPADPIDYAGYRGEVIGPRFFFDAVRPGIPWSPGADPPDDLIRTADDILAGRYRLFGGPPVELGLPPDWFAFAPPLAGRAPLQGLRHWSRVPLDEPGADVRLVWELSRFGWVYPLARAYRWTDDARYAEACWRLIKSWAERNPPNRGVHWASAQEAALRIMALAFAERAFFPAWSRQPTRLLEISRLVGFHAARIPPTLAYARAQGNNHLLSEGAGLYTAALLFPELRRSEEWRSLGRGLLETGLETQVFDDGGYVQHSTNYQRLALSLSVWSARLAELSAEPFPRASLRRIALLARSLAVQSSPESGESPVFGPDDGSDVLPLASTAHHDARPILAAASRLVIGESWYPPGAWDETSRWLGLGLGVRAQPPSTATLPETGLHYLEGPGTRGSLRCVRFQGRPGHADQLHADLAWGDQPFTIDPGSYLYNGPPPWQDGLAGAIVHNSPMVDGLEPMRRAGRFLWVGRAQGKLTGRWGGDHFQAVRGEHDGYRRLGVILTRTLALIDGLAWLVEDVAEGAGGRRMTVGWNLPDAPWTWSNGELRIDLGEGEWRLGWSGSLLRAGLARAGTWVAGEAAEGPVELWGWMSPTYSVRRPCLRLVLHIRGDLPLRLRTRLGRGGAWPEAMMRLWEDPRALDVALAEAERR